MKLSRVTQRFNDTPCSDGYSGAFLFNAQLAPFTEAVRDGITTQRRILELAPNTTLPPRRVIEFSGIHWIFGDGNVDTWKGKVIREKFPIHQSRGLAHVQTPYEVLTQTEGLKAHAGDVWTKTAKEVEETSHEYNQIVIYFSRTESVTAGQIITHDGRTYLVREEYPATAGHLGVIVEQMEDPILDVATTQGQMDPRTEQYTTGAAYSIIKLRWQTSFEYYSQATPDFLRGDIQTIMLATAAVTNGDKLTLMDGTDWRVLNTQVKGNIQYVHLRRY